MTKIDLKKSSGLSLVYDGEQLTSPDLSFNEVLTFTVDEMRPQLLNKDLTSPEIFYLKYRTLDQDGIYEKKNLRVNVYVIPANLAGIEYVKTKASKIAKYPRVLEVVHGSATVILQDYKDSKEGDIFLTPVKKNQKIVVPGNYALSLVNPRSAPLIVTEVLNLSARESMILDDMGGMSYYVIRKNAKQEIVRNPSYKFAGKPRRVNVEKISDELGITLKTPLIKQILRKYDKFNWLFEEDTFSL